MNFSWRFRLLTLGVLLGFPVLLAAQSQWSLSQVRQDSADYSLGVRSEFFLNSDALDNDFFLAFLGNRDFIETSVKDRISDRLGSENRFGGELNTGLFFSGPLARGKGDNPFRLSYFIGLADRQHVHSIFSEDVFRLGFYGNKRFAGDTAKLGDFELHAYQYQQLQTGVHYDNGRGRILAAGLSFLKGQGQQSIEVQQLDLFTSETGDYLAADTRARVRQNDSSNTNLDAFNGLGASIDVMVQYQFNLLEVNRHGNGWLRLEVNDLGYLWWNDESLDYRVDSVYEFEGVVFDNLFDLNDSLLQSQNPSRIVDDIENSQGRSSYRTLLPAQFRLTFSQDHHRGFNFSMRIEQRLQAQFKTFVLLKESYRLKPWFRVALMGGVGGYGRYYAGAEAQLKFAHWELLLGSNSLEGVVLPKNSSGSNGYLALRTSF
ncbi:MAG: DUF5723 family protein [Salibacteraceae bacterium]